MVTPKNTQLRTVLKSDCMGMNENLSYLKFDGNKNNHDSILDYY